MGKYDRYIFAWRERLRQEDDALRAAEAEARRSAQVCAERLVTAFSAERVYLTGSLIRQGRFHSGSDIDLAVVGLRADRYMRALSEIAGLANREVELIPLEDATPEMRDYVLKEGVILYERSEISAVEVGH